MNKYLYNLYTLIILIYPTNSNLVTQAIIFYYNNGFQKTILTDKKAYLQFSHIGKGKRSI